MGGDGNQCEGEKGMRRRDHWLILKCTHLLGRGKERDVKEREGKRREREEGEKSERKERVSDRRSGSEVRREMGSRRRGRGDKILG